MLMHATSLVLTTSCRTSKDVCTLSFASRTTPSARDPCSPPSFPLKRPLKSERGGSIPFHCEYSYHRGIPSPEFGVRSSRAFHLPCLLGSGNTPPCFRRGASIPFTCEYSQPPTNLPPELRSLSSRACRPPSLSLSLRTSPCFGRGVSIPVAAVLGTRTCSAMAPFRDRIVSTMAPPSAPSGKTLRLRGLPFTVRGAGKARTRRRRRRRTKRAERPAWTSWRRRQRWSDGPARRALLRAWRWSGKDVEQDGVWRRKGRSNASKNDPQAAKDRRSDTCRGRRNDRDDHVRGEACELTCGSIDVPIG